MQVDAATIEGCRRRSSAQAPSREGDHRNPSFADWSRIQAPFAIRRKSSSPRRRPGNQQHFPYPSTKQNQLDGIPAVSSQPQTEFAVSCCAECRRTVPERSCDAGLKESEDGVNDTFQWINSKRLDQAATQII